MLPIAYSLLSADLSMFLLTYFLVAEAVVAHKALTTLSLASCTGSRSPRATLQGPAIQHKKV